MPSTAPNFANASLSIRDLARSSLVKPTALANASCCKTFILAKSAADPTCFAISSETVARSLSKAACFAFSNVKSLPIKSSASSSDVIESSNCSSELAIFATCSKDNPNVFAFTTASAKAPGCALRDNKVALETSLIDSNICFSFKARLFCKLNALACPKKFLVTSSVDLPVTILISDKVPKVSTVTPATSFNCWNVSRFSSLI